MARSGKDKDSNEIVLGTFRIKSGLWEEFKALAAENNATATDLILIFVQSCVESGAVPLDQNANLDSIYQYIDKKLEDASGKGAADSSEIDIDAIYQYIDRKIDSNNAYLEDLNARLEKLEAAATVPTAPTADSQKQRRSDLANLQTTIKRLKKEAVPQTEIKKALDKHKYNVENFHEIREQVIAEFIPGYKNGGKK